MVRVAMPSSCAARRLSPAVWVSVAWITRRSISSSGVPTANDSSRPVDSACAIGRGQVLGTDCASLAEHDRALDHVLELAHVARPSYAIRRSSASRATLIRGLLFLRAVDLQEVIDQQRDVVAALRERRAGDGDHVQAIEEIFAEATGFDLGLEVAVGGGDQTKVRAVRATAERLVLAFLQDAQQLDLHRRRQLADLVEK